MVPIIKYRTLYYVFSGTLTALAVLALVLWGLKLGIDFKGGSLLMGNFSKEVPSQSDIGAALRGVGIDEVTIQPTGNTEMMLRFKDVDEPIHQQVLSALDTLAKKQGSDNAFVQESFDSIGPSVGKELGTQSFIAVSLVLILIICYIALAFRKVSYPLASWKYGLATLVALFHNIVIPLGLFAVLGHFSNVEISSGFIAAILTVLGYSVHDSIIVFDRVRENLIKHHGKTFEETVNISVNQTLVRSFNTSLTVILVLLAMYFLGGESIKYIALMLIVGIGVGTYSSIFIASMLLVTWYGQMARAAGARR